MVDKSLYNFYGIGMKLLGMERGLSDFIEKLDINCPENGKILDSGCGTGIIGISLIKKFPSATLIATDLDKRFLEQTMENARRYGVDESRIKTGLADITSPHEVTFERDNSKTFLKENQFNIISVGGVIGYSQDQKRTIRKLLKLLKPDGHLLIIELNESFMGKVTGAMYYYPIMPLAEIKETIESEGHNAQFIRLSGKHFPANLTRICISARKT